VAVVYDGTNQTLYLDGALSNSQSHTQSGYSATYKYQLGTGNTAGWSGGNGGWYDFNGLIDEPALYNRALSAAEIQALVNAGDKGKCLSGLIPLIAAQPQNQTVCAGTMASFSVTATGTGLSYQWRKGG